jgi:protein involved in polysaccharide export with SLBB domain
MRLLRKDLLSSVCVLCSLAIVAMLAGCDTNRPPAVSGPTKPPPPPDLRLAPLMIGDRLKVDLQGSVDIYNIEPQDIKEDGTINLPRIGTVAAAGKPPSKLEKEIEAKYVPLWYPHITVTVTPLARYFFVAGQVNGGGGSGRILYTSGMTILRGISAAGDFTQFANKRKVQVTRGIDKSIEYENCVDALKHPERDLPVYPGDMIWVGRRGLY